MDICRKIDMMRVAKGWTFYRLSQETGLSQQTFIRWMSGNTIPTTPALQSVCDAFGITLAEFFADLSGEQIVAVNSDTKELFENWKYLSASEKQSILAIMQNYIKGNK